MKDNLAFAFVLVLVLLSLVSMPMWSFSGPSPESALVQLFFAKPAAQEIRHIEPVTVIGRREALADESLASAKPEDSTVLAPSKSNQPSQ